MTKIERYEDRKRRQVCVDCEGKLAPGRVRCRRCLRDNNLATKRWYARSGSVMTEEENHTQASLYWSNRDVFAERLKARRLYKAANGICRECPDVAEEGHTKCTKHRKRDARKARERDARRRKAEKRELARYRPLDEIIDLTRIRVLRAARMLEWFTTFEINDDLGNHDERARNTTTQMVVRLARQGVLERDVNAMGDRRGSPWRYRITEKGRTEVDAVLRGGRPIRFYPPPRRSAA